MKRLYGTGGYTIVEALIFLVVSAALFASVIGVYSSQNRKTQFYQSVQTFDQKIRDMLNDVDAGFYPTLNNIQCTDSGPGGSVSINEGSVEQGKNQECVFAGKALQMNLDESNYDIYTLAGRRQATTIDEAGTRAVTFLRDRGFLSAGLVVTDVKTPSGSHSGLAVLSSFGEEVGDGNSGVGNRMTLAVIDNPIGADGGISLGTGNISRANTGILVCIQEAGGGRKATILVGGAQNGTRVTIDGECTI